MGDITLFPLWVYQEKKIPVLLKFVFYVSIVAIVKQEADLRIHFYSEI